MRVQRVGKHSRHLVLGTMADREMAIAIGRYIIELQRDLATFIENKIATDGGQKIANRLARNARFCRHRMLREIGDETSSSSLIRALHRVFVEEGKPN